MTENAMRYVIIPTSCALGLILTFAGCQKATPALAKSSPPAKVSAVVKEDQLTTVELTEAAEKRLAIETAVIGNKSLKRHRTYGGEIMLPVGATVVVSAPVAGKLQVPADGKVPKVGATVKEKQAVLSLFPLLSPAERITLATQLADAEGQVQQAETQVKANKIALERAEQQAKSGVGLGKTLDDAKAQMILSEKALQAALSRKKVLDATRMDGELNPDQSPFVINAPQTGIIRSMTVMPDEIVTAGTILFEVMNTDSLWVRVPVYVGESNDVASDQPAEVGELASRAGQRHVTAQPIDAPPTATPLASTVDYYYQVANAGGALRPGQRVSVQVPLTGDAEQRAIPWSAVVQDIYGGHWIYERTAEHRFVRRRVQVKQVVETWAILDQGPPNGTRIAISGVAELFGTEFGFGK